MSPSCTTLPLWAFTGRPSVSSRGATLEIVTVLPRSAAGAAAAASIAAAARTRAMAR